MGQPARAGSFLFSTRRNDPHPPGYGMGSPVLSRACTSTIIHLLLLQNQLRQLLDDGSQKSISTVDTPVLKASPAKRYKKQFSCAGPLYGSETLTVPSYTFPCLTSICFTRQGMSGPHVPIHNHCEPLGRFHQCHKVMHKPISLQVLASTLDMASYTFHPTLQADGME